MKQALELNAILEGVSTRQDGSLGIRISTRELTGEEILLIMELRNLECLVSFKPKGFTVTKEIKTELSRKTQSERIRSILFCWWSELGSPGEYEAFYRSETEKYITSIKTKLKPV